MDDSAPWKTEETIIIFSQLPVLSGLSRFGGCHISPLDLGLDTSAPCVQDSGYLKHKVQVFTLKTVSSAYDPERLRLLRIEARFYAGQKEHGLGG